MPNSEDSPLLKQTWYRDENRKTVLAESSFESYTSLWLPYRSWTNFLFSTVPLGIFFGWTKYNDTLNFVFNFLAIIPLSTLLGTATEIVASFTNETIGGLLNATFGNAVEVILGFSSLRLGLMDVVKATLLGSVLSNLLFVLGWSFLLGGMFHTTQAINPAIADSNISVLAVALFGFLIPAVFSASEDTSLSNIQLLSLFTSCFMFLLYLLFLFFELVTHAHLYDTRKLVRSGSMRRSYSSINQSVVNSPVTFHRKANVLPLYFAILLLLASIFLTSWCSEYLIASIEGFSKQTRLSSTFVAFVLLPIVGNATEHMAACSFAIKGNIDLSISIACGSSVQVALFVAPVLVFSSWFFSSEVLTLDFHLFETAMLAVAVVVTSLALRDNSSNWLEGAELLISYGIISAAFFFK
eukprot:jgi/Galph1/447/GphlegSOOS_G5215.1